MRILKNGDKLKKIPIRNAQIGKAYFTPGGMKIEILRQRPDDEGIVVRSITSGGHEIVLPGGLMVTGDELPVVIADEVVESKAIENTLPNLVYHIIKESNLPLDEIVDITGFDKKVVEEELQELLELTIQSGDQSE